MGGWETTARFTNFFTPPRKIHKYTHTHTHMNNQQQQQETMENNSPTSEKFFSPLFFGGHTPTRSIFFYSGPGGTTWNCTVTYKALAKDTPHLHGNSMSGLGAFTLRCKRIQFMFSSSKPLEFRLYCNILLLHLIKTHDTQSVTLDGGMALMQTGQIFGNTQKYYEKNRREVIHSI